MGRALCAVQYSLQEVRGASVIGVSVVSGKETVDFTKALAGAERVPL
jgi:hypothetical protein